MKITRPASFVASVCAFAVLAAPAAPQSPASPFLPQKLYQDLVNELSGDRAYEHVRQLTHFHRTGPGHQDFYAAAQYIERAARETGLQDVKLIRQKYDGASWSPRSGEAWVTGDGFEQKIADYGAVAVSIADYSRSANVTADLIDVGDGVSAAAYAGKDVRGKIVLATGGAGAVHREAVWKRGAAGVVSAASNRPESFDAPEQVAWNSIGVAARGIEGVADGTPGAFAIMVSPRVGRALQKRLATAPLKARVVIDADVPAVAEQVMIEGWIRGSEIAGQQIVLTAHIQEEKTSANDDGSGCGNLLEIARTLNRLIAEGRVARPKRDIRFWWVNEFDSQEQYFRENQKDIANMLLNFNQDMVGGRQSWGGRVQYGARLPWSIPHPLEDVTESILGMVRDSNTSYLSNRGTGQPQPFLKEVVAVKGSRDPFHAFMLPYWDSTDHHAFNPRHIGVPGTSLTNWPDEYIHSTGDDLENIDATQLERNAVVVSGTALYFASLGADGVPALGHYAAAQSRARMSANLATAVSHVARATPESRARAYRQAKALVAQSALKEKRSLAGLTRLAPAIAPSLLAEIVDRLDRGVASDHTALDAAYRGIAGSAPRTAAPSPAEQTLASRVYAPVGTVAAWQDALPKIGATSGLHAMMRFEALNFVDGKRTGLEVYEATAAQALAAGEWYYGDVTPEEILDLLEKMHKAGGFTLAVAAAR